MDIHETENRHLSMLKKALEYELGTMMLIVLSFVAGSVILIMMIAAILFSPFMLYVLYREEKFAWIIWFIVIVLLPAIGVAFIDTGWTYRAVLGVVPLLLFYIYCFVLRLSMPDWED